MRHHLEEKLPVFRTEITWMLPIEGANDVLGRLAGTFADALLEALRESGAQLVCDRTSHRPASEPLPGVDHRYEADGDSATVGAESLDEKGVLHGLINVRTLAAVLGVSQRQVWKLIASGRLPAPLRLARCVRWRADEIRSWIDAGCPSPDRWQATGR